MVCGHDHLVYNALMSNQLPRPEHALPDEPSLTPHATLPCPHCEGLNRLVFQLGEQLQPRQCKRCGEAIDPRNVFDIRFHQLEVVVSETTVTLLLLVADPAGDLWNFTNLMRTALKQNASSFVVARTDSTQAASFMREHAIAKTPALTTFQGGCKLSAMPLPKIAGRAAAFIGQLLPGAQPLEARMPPAATADPNPQELPE